MTQRTLARIALLAAVAYAALSGTATAQAVRGTLLGTVHDTQGAAVPGVNVTATETQTNISRTAVCGSIRPWAPDTCHKPLRIRQMCKSGVKCSELSGGRGIRNSFAVIL